jgi:hypothetical protein
MVVIHMSKRDLLTTTSDSSHEPAALDPRTFGLVKAGYSINETIDLMPLGRTSIYEAIKDGRLPIRKAGKRTIILALDLAVFLAGLPGAPARRASKAP